MGAWFGLTRGTTVQVRWDHFAIAANVKEKRFFSRPYGTKAPQRRY